MSIIHVLALDGSPRLVTMKSLYGDEHSVGIGGAEYAMLTMCEEWTKAGHEVVLFNDPRELGASPFEQRNIGQFHPDEPRDILINFRSPNPKTIVTTNCKKIWWTTDQQTVGDYRAFAGQVHKIVTISPRHSQYFKDTYGIQNSIPIDIPVRMDDFDNQRKYETVQKIPNRLIFTSVPARGLDNLWRIYPIIQKEVPDVSLVITSDYRLWGVGAGNEQFRVKWMPRTNVQYLGAVSRARMVRELLQAQILLYPSNYDELFCVAVSEAQYAACYPVTSATGALPTTNMGTVLYVDADNPQNDRTFANAVIELLNNPMELASKQQIVYEKAKERFNPQRILDQWNNEVFN